MGSYQQPSLIRQTILDWQSNTNLKSRLIVLMFRLASRTLSGGNLRRVAGLPLRIAYKILVEWLWGCELPARTKVGTPLTIHHGHALVVNPESVIGRGCTLRHCTTLGSRLSGCDAPIIGNNVDIGCNAVVLGKITIGDHARIGAGAVVLGNVPAGATYAGNPAKEIRKS